MQGSNFSLSESGWTFEGHDSHACGPLWKGVGSGVEVPPLEDFLCSPRIREQNSISKWQLVNHVYCGIFFIITFTNQGSWIFLGVNPSAYVRGSIHQKEDRAI